VPNERVQDLPIGAKFARKAIPNQADGLGDAFALEQALQLFDAHGMIKDHKTKGFLAQPGRRFL